MRYEANYVISDDHKFIYFNGEKVACSSIKAALFPLFGIDTTVHELDLNRVRQFFKQPSYRITKEQLTRELNGKYKDYFKFAFVRNPWDRLVSCYSDKVMDAKKPKKQDFGKPALNPPDEKFSELYKGMYKGMRFAEFVEAVCAIPDDKANTHFRSQYKLICGPGKDKPIMADFVGRFENLAADFDVVAERIGGTQKLQLPHRQRSRSRESRPYTDFYDERLKKLVCERFQEDIEIFNYSFGDSHSEPLSWPRDGQAGSRHLNQDAEESGGQSRSPNEMEATIWRLQQRVTELEHDLARERWEARQLKRRLKDQRSSLKDLRSSRRQLENLQSSRTWRLLNKLNRIQTKVSGK